MDFLASCTVKESQQYTGKLVVPAEEGGKPGKVMLNIVSDVGDRSLLKLIGGNVKCITFIGDMQDFEEESFEDIPDGVFHEVQIEDFDVDKTPVYSGITTLVRVPDGYSDMRSLFSICSKRDDVRVIGGNLLGIDGVRIGRYEGGKDKIYPVFNGVYDSFFEVKLSELGDITELAKKVKKKIKTGEDGGAGKKKKASSKESSGGKKQNKIAISFGCLFSESDEEEF